jgi:Uma2 family endonuclease
VIHIAVSEPVRILPDSKRRFSDREYLAFCRANPELNVERTSEGEIVIVPPAGGESSYRNIKASRYLDDWAEKDGRGTAFDSSAQFMLPDGSALSPDAAWVSHESLNKLTWRQRRQFLRLTPEFIIEVRSPGDSPKKAKSKWSNGSQTASSWAG